MMGPNNTIIEVTVSSFFLCKCLSNRHTFWPEEWPKNHDLMSENHVTFCCFTIILYYVISSSNPKSKCRIPWKTLVNFLCKYLLEIVHKRVNWEGMCKFHCRLSWQNQNAIILTQCIMFQYAVFEFTSLYAQMVCSLQFF